MFLPPERRRWVILALVFAAMVLNYLDRQVVSVLKPTLKETFGIDDRGYATLLNAFVLSYACAYPVAGWLADRFGAGRVMLWGLLAWSSASFVAGFTKTFGQLAFCRGLLGITEPTTFPSQLRVVAMWFPSKLRATANSISASGTIIGAIVAPPLVAWLAVTFNWRAAFFVPAAAGLVLAVLWKMLYRDPPSTDAPDVDRPAPSAPALPWRKLWVTRSLWGILLSRFISDPVWYFCLFWLPGYLQESSGLTLAQIGMVGWIPFLAADVGGIGSSMFSDRLVKKGSAPLRARKLTLLGAALVAPICAFTPHMPHAAATLVIFSVVGAVCVTWLLNLGVVVSETFPTANVGSVWGIAGACGAFGAILFNLLVGELLSSLGPGRVFAVMALLHPLAAVVLLAVVRPVTPPGAPRHRDSTPV